MRSHSDSCGDQISLYTEVGIIIYFKRIVEKNTEAEKGGTGVVEDIE